MQALYDAALEAFDVMGKKHIYLGEVGAGESTAFANP